MKRLLSTIMMLFILIASGQVALKKSSISSAGGSQISGTKNLVYTLGELAVQEENVNEIHLSEGFINPDLIEANGLENFQFFRNVQIFPNPVETDLYIEFPDNHQYEVRLFDINGKELYANYGQNSIKINMRKYKRSIYLLLIIDRKNKLFKHFKISKE